MQEKRQAEKTVENMRKTVFSLSEMLERAVSELRRLQKQGEKELGRHFESKDELSKQYDTKSMKELTAILKDVATVERALSERVAEQEGTASTGVVLLPMVMGDDIEHLEE